jgi:hypothetical protein
MNSKFLQKQKSLAKFARLSLVGDEGFEPPTPCL